jgi:hypothetical protein
LAHICEEKRRFQQKDILHCRLGYQAFSSMYKKISNTKKTEEEFRKSTYYLACVRWGRFVIDVNCIDSNAYLNWLLAQNIPIDKWNTDSVYDLWLPQYAILEMPWDAIGRSVNTMIEWNSDDFYNYFLKAGDNRIIFDLTKNKISPWIIFLSSKGKSWLGKLDLVELKKIWPWIDPAKWGGNFEKYNEEKDIIIQFLNEKEF